MTQPRESTRPFPEGKSRESWVEVERVAPATRNGLVEFEYEVYEDAETRTRGDRPFLIVNHRAQFREQHQRIVRGPNGGLMHVDAGEVLPEDVETFLATDNRAYVFNPDTGRWHRRRGGQVLDGFEFAAAPWAGGRIEKLDPQWERETFTLPLAEQVAEAKQRRLDRAEAKQESGDKRGTTLNLQVGAGADDTGLAIGGTWTGGDAFVRMNNNGTTGASFRFSSAGLPNGATINSAVISGVVFSTSHDDPEGNFDFEDADDPAAPTSTSDFNGRTLTGQTVAWSTTGVYGGASTFVDAPDISTPLGDVVARAGFDDSSALQVFFDDTVSGTKSLIWRTYEHDTALAAKLDIDYTAGGGGPTNATPTASLSAATSAALAGAIVAIQVGIPTASLAASTAAGLAGSVTAVKNATVSGNTATATAAANAGTVAVGVGTSVSGNLATATAAALDGSPVAVKVGVPTSSLATATSAAMDGSTVAITNPAISGNLAAATAAALDGSVTTGVVISVTGSLATATTAALQGSPVAVKNGEPTSNLAAATGAALAGDPVAVQNAAVGGNLATATSAALAGSVDAQAGAGGASVSGNLASASAAALDGDALGVQVGIVGGNLAAATAAANAGAVSDQVVVSVSGNLASATAAGLAGAVVAIKVAAVSGNSAQSSAAALAGAVLALQIVALAGNQATATAAALTGTASANVAAGVGQTAEFDAHGNAQVSLDAHGQAQQAFDAEVV